MAGFGDASARYGRSYRLKRCWVFLQHGNVGIRIFCLHHQSNKRAIANRYIGMVI